MATEPMAPSPPVHRGFWIAQRHSSLIWIGLFVVVLAVIGWWPLSKFWQTPNFADISVAMNENRFLDAEALARSWIVSHPNDAAALVILGEILQKQGALFEAMDTFQRVSPNAGEQYAVARLATASILLKQGRLADAETKLRDFDLDTRHSLEVDGLWVRLLSFSGRQWESIPYLQRTLNSVGELPVNLVRLANPNIMFPPPDDVFANMLRIRDPLGLLGCGRTAASLGRTEQAIKLLRECLVVRPDLIAAHVELGALLFDSGDIAAFEEVMRILPAAAEQHPMTWFLRGQYGQGSGRVQEAIRCYWEVLRRQPDHDRSMYQLGQLLAAEGRIDDAKVFLDRARWVTQLIESAVKVYESPKLEHEIVSCARSTFELGRLWECQGWCRYLQTLSPDNSTLIELLDVLRINLTDETPWVLPEGNLAFRYDFTSYPLPQPIQRSPGSRITSGLEDVSTSRIAFVDESEPLGLQFVYFNGCDRSTKGKRMFEYMGGGVAAFDYDHDGWCDIYFTQGTTWPPDQSNSQFMDVMFRNIGGNLAQNVTSYIGIKDIGFGQGVSAGDFNNDGFVDLYVANIDGNRMYQNNGDGTFVDVTRQCGLGTHSHWTTSCMIADLNGDSLPDVYDVTYLDGDNIFSRRCNGQEHPQSCLPVSFPAAPDQVYMNAGDGTFREISHEWGFDVPNGDGLGVVAADFDDSGTISVFVGNDGRANFFFVPETMDSGSLKWNEIGVISGLAYDDSGAAQACMGIAAGDADNDGRIDLFVTNFYNESSTLYINRGAFSFSDRARVMGLRESSLLMLGFGTQFIDADRDGWEDIIQVNGHIDDLTSRQIPYKMRPQFFQNSRTKFVERFGKSIGSFFDEPKLGRGLARFDWNRDGLNDVVISHVDDPAALLTNRTQSAGSGIGIRLVGTKRSRDAIGTRVTVHAGSNRFTRQLVGGDGFQVTNERRLDFGFAENRNTINVEIRWIGGRVDRFQNVPANCEYLAVEGRDELLQLNIN